MEASFRPIVRLLVAFGCALAALLVISSRRPGRVVDSGMPVPADRRQARCHSARRLRRRAAHDLLLRADHHHAGPEHHQSPAGDRRDRATSSGPSRTATSLASTRSSSMPMERSRGSTSCTCTMPSGWSTADRSSPRARRRRSSNCHQGSAGRAIPVTPGSSTTCCTTSLNNRPRSTSSGEWTSSRRLADAAAITRCRPSGWTSPGTRASTRSSTRCDRMGTTAPTPSPIRRLPRTSIRATASEVRLRGRRAATGASERPRAGRPAMTRP